MDRIDVVSCLSEDLTGSRIADVYSVAVAEVEAGTVHQELGESLWIVDDVMEVGDRLTPAASILTNIVDLTSRVATQTVRIWQISSSGMVEGRSGLSRNEHILRCGDPSGRV